MAPGVKPPANRVAVAVLVFSDDNRLLVTIIDIIRFGTELLDVSDVWVS